MNVTTADGELRMRIRGRTTPPPAAARGRFGAVIATTAVMLAACAGTEAAPDSVALLESAGFPADAPIVEPLFDDSWAGEPVGWLASDRQTITIVSYGSSSCPFIATAIDVLDDSAVVIDLRQARAEACTDDLAPRTHVLTTPEGWGRADGPYRAELSRSLDAFGPSDAIVTTLTLWPVPEPAVIERPTVAFDTVRGLPEGITVPEDQLDAGEPLAVWGDNRATIEVVTWGSSGCPPPAVSIRTVAEDELAVVFGAIAPRPCTADFAPTTHRLLVPPGIGSGPTTLAMTIEFDGAEPTQYRIAVVERP